MAVKYLEKRKKQLKTSKIGDLISSINIIHDELTLYLESKNLLTVLQFLRDNTEFQYQQLIDICGVDYPKRSARFDVVYHLLSVTLNCRIRLIVKVAEGETVPSTTALFRCANWYEREVWDLYGIGFAKHPDMRRILTDYGFSGHPLRKDFPLTGHVEVEYDNIEQEVRYKPVYLAQQYRDFDTLSPWEGTKYILPGDEKATK